MNVISEKVLIADRIAAVGRGQPLSRRGGWSIRLAVVAKEITNIKNGALIEYLGDLANRLVIVIDLKYRVQYLWLKAELRLDLVYARRAWTHAARSIDAAEDEG